MAWYSFAAVGYEGRLVAIEVDIRRGIPGMDIVGLPGPAVREARERIRVAMRKSGFEFPKDRMLVNLSPADLPKAGCSYDLPIALAVLEASGQIPALGTRFLALGELSLSGDVRAVAGTLSAVAAASAAGMSVFFVPRPNLREARSLCRGDVYGLDSLKEAVGLLHLVARGEAVPGELAEAPSVAESGESFDDILGQDFLKRAALVAAAGRHNLFLFGPPGSGKTMAATRMSSILPPLSRREALEVTRIYSLAGLLPEDSGLVKRRPFRCPHHGASREGLTGGGKSQLPGEVSLAHYGILFLDEAAEFPRNVLQTLREPLESHRIALTRAGQKSWFPSDFQLVLASNPCPCGNLGREEKVCMCSQEELFRYWRRLGGALLDRVDIRFPLVPSGWPATGMTPGLSGAEPAVSAGDMKAEKMRERVAMAAEIQERRNGNWNSRINPAGLKAFCQLMPAEEEILKKAAVKLGLSGRAVVSALKVARTIADLAMCPRIEKAHLLEALQYRRYGDGDNVWTGS